MSFKQYLLKFFYPLFWRITKMIGKNFRVLKSITKPNVDFYSLKAIDNSGKEISFNQFRGKKVLIVNTASNCGYTRQYKMLEKLYEERNNDLAILAFPSNDFRQQEKLDDNSIAVFCSVNYKIQFPLMKKSIVVKHSGQNEVFRWLSDKDKNGWNDQEPTWNFCKYLVDENGVLRVFAEAGVVNGIMNYE